MAYAPIEAVGILLVWCCGDKDQPMLLKGVGSGLRARVLMTRHE